MRRTMRRTMRLTMHPPRQRAPAASATQSSDSARRLEGPWLALARVASVALALRAMGTFIAGLARRLAHLHAVSAADAPDGWTPEAFQSALAQLGLSIASYHGYRIALDLAFALCFVLVAALLLWRNSSDW